MIDAILHQQQTHRNLTFFCIGDADHSTFGDGRMFRHHFFDTTGGQTMPCDINHIIGATHNEYIAVFITVAPVTGQIKTGILAPIAVFVTLMVTPDRWERTRRQRSLDHDRAFLIRPNLFAIGIQHT